MSSTKLTPTLYDETHRGTWHKNPHIASLGNSPSLIAHLEHHDPTTDGSFAVCIASGSGNFISKKLYESIPPEHRPTLKAEACQVGVMLSEDQTALGSVFVPIILKQAGTEEPFRIVLHAYVLPRLLMGMFLSDPAWIDTVGFKQDGREYGCEFGDGRMVTVKGVPYSNEQRAMMNWQSGR